MINGNALALIPHPHTKRSHYFGKLTEIARSHTKKISLNIARKSGFERNFFATDFFFPFKFKFSSIPANFNFSADSLYVTREGTQRNKNRRVAMSASTHLSSHDAFLPFLLFTLYFRTNITRACTTDGNGGKSTRHKSFH
jgi:hypothetical protein